jgi:hypothetical protein
MTKQTLTEIAMADIIRLADQDTEHAESKRLQWETDMMRLILLFDKNNMDNDHIENAILEQIHDVHEYLATEAVEYIKDVAQENADFAENAEAERRAYFENLI